MVIVDDDRSAALIIRVWQEDGAQGFRARLTAADTSPGSDGGGERTVAVASSAGDVLAAVSTWLDAFLTPPAEGSADRT